MLGGLSVLHFSRQLKHEPCFNKVNSPPPYFTTTYSRSYDDKRLDSVSKESTFFRNPLKTPVAVSLVCKWTNLVLSLQTSCASRVRVLCGTRFGHRCYTKLHYWIQRNFILCSSLICALESSQLTGHKNITKRGVKFCLYKTREIRWLREKAVNSRRYCYKEISKFIAGNAEGS